MDTDARRYCWILICVHLRLSVVPDQKTKPQMDTDAHRYCFLSSVSIDGQLTVRISARSTYIHDGPHRLHRSVCTIIRPTKEHAPDPIRPISGPLYKRSFLPDHPRPYQTYTPTSSPHQPGLPILRIAPAIYRNIYFFPVSPDRPRLIVIHSLKQTDQHHYPLHLYITPQIILATFSQNLNMFPEFSVPNEV
jgi:hypothetical protein